MSRLRPSLRHPMALLQPCRTLLSIQLNPDMIGSTLKVFQVEGNGDRRLLSMVNPLVKRSVLTGTNLLFQFVSASTGSNVRSFTVSCSQINQTFSRCPIPFLFVNKTTVTRSSILTNCSFR